LLQQSAVFLFAEKRVRFILRIAESVNVIIGTILANNRRGRMKAFSVAVEVVASA
jgi:hypothetical protein